MGSRFVCLLSEKRQYRRRLSLPSDWHFLAFSEKEIAVLDANWYFPGGKKIIPLREGCYRLRNRELCYTYLLFVGGEKEAEEAYVSIAKKEMIFRLRNPFLSRVKLRYRNHCFLCNTFALFKGNRPYDGGLVETGDEFYLLDVHILVLRDTFLIKGIYHDETGMEATSPDALNFVAAKCERSPFPEVAFPSFQAEAPQEKKTYRQLGPAFTMSLCMLGLAGIQILTARQEKKGLLQIFPLILLPLGMALSGLFWPLLYRFQEKRKYRLAVRAFLQKQKDHSRTVADIAHRTLCRFRETEEKAYFRCSQLRLGRLNERSLVYFSLGKGRRLLPLSGKEYPEERWPFFSAGKCLVVYEEEKNGCAYLEKLLLELYSSRISVPYRLVIYDPHRLLKEYCLEDFHLFEEGQRKLFSQEKEVREYLCSCAGKELVLVSLDAETRFDNVDFCLYYSQKEVPILSETEAVCVRDNCVRYRQSAEEYSLITELDGTNNRSLFLALARESWRRNSPHEEVPFYRLNEQGEIDFLYYLSQRYKGIPADFARSDEGILSFDLHEEADGPHGLIAGTTGSGKSELLCSLLLSACIYNPPDKVNLILIDYKGGTVANELSYRGKRIPHIVGELSDTSPGNSLRLQAALKNECKRREKLFAQLAAQSGKSVLNIDDYRANHPREYALPQKAHLLIVVDEFAQLKEENPAFLKELLQISRIGRSLGIHLLLATQKPSGCVNEEILANSHFRIVLKVLSASDSRDILGDDSALHLRKPGSFCLKRDGRICGGRALYGRLSTSENSISVSDECFRHFSQEGETLRQSLCRQILAYSYPELPSAFILPKAHAYSSEERRIREKKGEILLGEMDDYVRERRFPFSFPLQEGNSLLAIGNEKKILSLIYASCARQGIPIIRVAAKRRNIGVISDNILFDEEEKMVILYQRLSEGDNERLRVLLIEDSELCFAYNELWKEKCAQLIKLLRYKQIIPILLAKSCLSLSFRLVHSVTHRISLGPLSAQEILSFWGKKSCEENITEWQGDLLGWQEALQEKQITKCMFPPFMKDLPDVISPKIREKEVLLGINVRTHEEVWGAEDMELMAEKESTLEYYRFYKKLRFYAKETGNFPAKRPVKFVWIGPGLYRQSLFPYRGIQDLEEDEGCIVDGKKIIRIRSVCG